LKHGKSESFQIWNPDHSFLVNYFWNILNNKTNLVSPKSPPSSIESPHGDFTKHSRTFKSNPSWKLELGEARFLCPPDDFSSLGFALFDLNQ
jgi:hypothetical protein